MKFFDRILGYLAYTVWDTKEGHVRLGEWRKLRAQQYAPALNMQQLQREKLARLIKHAQTTSAW